MIRHLVVFLFLCAYVTAPAQGQVPVGPLTLSAYVQSDALFALAEDPFEGEDTFRIRRARFVLKGEITRHIDWEASAELTSSPVLRDGFVTLKPARWANVRIGQFVPLFGLERQTSTSRLEAIDRIIDTLAPIRDLGLELRAERPLGGWLTYGVAVINGVGQNELDDNDAKDVVARLAAVVPGAESITVGVSGATGEQPDGRRTRGGADIEVKTGPFRVAVEFLRQSYGGLPDRDGYYILGAHRRDSVELVGRWSRVEKVDAVTKRLELGGNYYFAGRTRLMAALVIEPGGPGTPVGAIARVQLAF